MSKPWLETEVLAFKQAIHNDTLASFFKQNLLLSKNLHILLPDSDILVGVYPNLHVKYIKCTSPLGYACCFGTAEDVALLLRLKASKSFPMPARVGKDDDTYPLLLVSPIECAMVARKYTCMRLVYEPGVLPDFYILSIAYPMHVPLTYDGGIPNHADVDDIAAMLNCLMQLDKKKMLTLNDIFRTGEVTPSSWISYLLTHVGISDDKVIGQFLYREEFMRWDRINHFSMAPRLGRNFYLLYHFYMHPESPLTRPYLARQIRLYQHFPGNYQYAFLKLYGMQYSLTRVLNCWEQDRLDYAEMMRTSKILLVLLSPKHHPRLGIFQGATDIYRRLRGFLCPEKISLMLSLLLQFRASVLDGKGVVELSTLVDRATQRDQECQRKIMIARRNSGQEPLFHMDGDTWEAEADAW